MHVAAALADDLLRPERIFSFNNMLARNHSFRRMCSVTDLSAIDDLLVRIHSMIKRLLVLRLVLILLIFTIIILDLIRVLLSINLIAIDKTGRISHRYSHDLLVFILILRNFHATSLIDGLILIIWVIHHIGRLRLKLLLRLAVLPLHTALIRPLHQFFLNSIDVLLARAHTSDKGMVLGFEVVAALLDLIVGESHPNQLLL